MTVALAFIGFGVGCVLAVPVTVALISWWERDR